jgi:CheY-like chemotaxis protein
MPLAPTELVSDLELMLRNTAQAKGIGFEAAVLGTVPERIESDPTRLCQILVNLLGNAIKFTEQGGVRLQVGVAAGASHRLVFSISDTGPGLAPEARERVFEPFSQADASTTRRYGGTGLGLTISRHLARLLGGDIELQTIEGHGSTFSLWIPLSVPAPDAAVSGAAATGAREVRDFLEQVRTSGRGGRVLLVEDGADNRALLSFTLGKAGFRVTHAENGQIGSEIALAALANGQPFDVVLMDMQMPVLDGYAATRRLRGADYTGPIIALTAHAMEGDRELCLAAGCTDFLTKPIDRRQLVRTVLDHMEPRKPEA